MRERERERQREREREREKGFEYKRKGATVETRMNTILKITE